MKYSTSNIEVEREVYSTPQGQRPMNRRVAVPAAPRRAEDSEHLEHAYDIGHDAGLMSGFAIGLVVATVGMSTLALVIFA